MTWGPPREALPILSKHNHLLLSLFSVLHYGSVPPHVLINIHLGKDFLNKLESENKLSGCSVLQIVKWFIKFAYCLPNRDFMQTVLILRKHLEF